MTHLTIYGRYERRWATFEGFTSIWVSRLTAGLRADFYESFALKVEGLLNAELRGAPVVDNDVVTSSLVWTW